LKPEGLAFPVNTMWVNEKGEGARVVLVKKDSDGGEALHEQDNDGEGPRPEAPGSDSVQ
jgi:hypothetical protein